MGHYMPPVDSRHFPVIASPSYSVGRLTREMSGWQFRADRIGGLMFRNRCLVLACFVSAAFLLVRQAPAQITSGIRGTVTDPSGAAVPGARITATNTGTGFAATATSSNDGTYTLTLLPVGQYTLEVEANGFKKLQRTNITLTTNQVAGINVVLQVGAVSASEEVEAGAQVPTAMTGTDERNAAYMSVNGNRLYMTQYNLDGGDYSGKRMNTGMNYPNPDAIEEFRFITNNYSAEFGKNPGGIMNVVTKSGTNSYHGSLWEFNRNSALAARNFFLPNVAQLNQNQYGVSGGGPIKKNKLFFFGTAQWMKIRQGRATSSTSPPTTAERAGDFSGSKTIIDPATNAPFPGNRIPANRLDPVALGLINLVPLPNSPSGRFIGAYAEPVDNNQYLFKTDYNQSERSRFTFSWFEDATVSTSLLDFGRLTTPLVNYTGPGYKSSYNDSRDAIA